MPKATSTYTPNPVVTLQIAASRLSAHPAGGQASSYQDAVLREACRAATVTLQAMTALSLSVADLPPDDARHAAVHAAIGRLQPVWRDQVEHAWTVPAIGPGGLRDKAELLNALIDLHDDASVEGNPALGLAGSLAVDVLQQHGALTT